MEYMSPKEASEKWGITERRVQALCSKGKVAGALMFSRVWAIPKDAEKPKDGRYRENKILTDNVSEDNRK